jgi:hypothetical protein
MMLCRERMGGGCGVRTMIMLLDLALSTLGQCAPAEAISAAWYPYRSTGGVL